MNCKKWIPCVLLLLLLVLQGGCSQQAEGWSLYNQDGVVLLQALVSEDDPVVPAMQQAAADLSAETGVPVQLLLCHDITDYDVLIDDMYDQVEQATVAGIIMGRDFTELRTAAYLYQSYGVPVVALGNSASSLEHACVVKDFYSAEQLAEAIYAELAAQECRRVAVLYSSTKFETELVHTLSDRLEQEGIQLASLWSVKELSLTPARASGEWDLLEADAVCVICDSDTEVPELVTKLRALGVSQTMIFADNGVSDSLTEQEAAAMEGDLFIPEYEDAQQQAYEAVYALGQALLDSDGTSAGTLAALQDENRYMKCGSPEKRIIPERMTDGVLVPIEEEG